MFFLPEQKLHRTHEHFMAVVVSVLWVWHISATTSKCLHTARLCHLASVTPLYHHVPHGCLYLLPCSFWIMAKPLHHRPRCHLVFQVYIYDFSLPLVRALWCDLWLDICPLAVPLPHPGLRNHWDKWKPVSATVHSDVGPHRGFETVFLIPPLPKKEPSSREEGLRWAAPFPSIRDHEPPIPCPCPKLIKKTSTQTPGATHFMSLCSFLFWVCTHCAESLCLALKSFLPWWQEPLHSQWWRPPLAPYEPAGLTWC